MIARVVTKQVGAWLARLDAIPNEQHAYRGDAMRKDVLWETGLPIVASGAANAVAGIVFDKGTTLAASNGVAATPTLTVTNVEFKSTASASATLSVAGKTKVTLAQSNFTGPLPSIGLVTVAGAGELVIIGATFDGLGGEVEGFGYQLIGAAGTSKLTLDGVTLRTHLWRRCPRSGAPRISRARACGADLYWRDRPRDDGGTGARRRFARRTALLLSRRAPTQPGVSRRATATVLATASGPTLATRAS